MWIKRSCITSLPILQAVTIFSCQCLFPRVLVSVRPAQRDVVWAERAAGEHKLWNLRDVSAYSTPTVFVATRVGRGIEGEKGWHVARVSFVWGEERGDNKEWEGQESVAEGSE